MRSKASEEIRAAAVADLLAGEQPAIVAQRYGLSRDLVKQWKQRYVTGLVTAATAEYVPVERAMVRYPTIEEQQQRIIGMVYRLLAAKLEASERIANHATGQWLDQQSAGGLAELGDYFDRTAVTILALLIRRDDGTGDA